MQTQRDEGLGAGGAWERPKLSLQGPNSREWTSPSSQTETETQLKTPELTHFSSVLKTTQVPRPNNWNGEGNGTPLQCSCLENPMDGGAWWAAVHGAAKSRTRLSSFTFTFRFHALEKEMATHSSVLAWRIPGTGEPGGLPSQGVAQSRT